LQLSAQLYPVLKPLWYAPGYVTTNSPGCCIMRVNGMPFCSSSVGEISSSWWRKVVEWSRRLKVQR
jgi:hypothetical protein